MCFLFRSCCGCCGRNDDTARHCCGRPERDCDGSHEHSCGCEQTYRCNRGNFMGCEQQRCPHSHE